MKKISVLAALLLGLVPVATITLATLDHVSDPEAAHSPSLFQFLFTTFSSLSGLYSLALLCVAYILVQKVAVLKEEVEDLHFRHRDLIREHEDQKNRNEVLAATREVALVLNKDVKFEKVLEEVLRIATYLVGPRPPEEISIFVRDEYTKRLRPRARMKDDEVVCDDKLDGEAVDARHVQGVVESGRSLVEADGDVVALTLPLVADREILGAMKVRAVLEGDREERETRIGVLQRNMEEFSRVVALAVKTPDLYTRTIQDGLTRLFTKRHFEEQLRIYFDQARREGSNLALLFVDVDHFKKVNDTYGHQTGDLVLREVAATIKAGIRSYCSAYRYGGEEMVVILPRTTSRQATLAAERLRKKIEAKTYHSDKKEPVKVTASLGIAEYVPTMAEPGELVKRADEAVYRAKQGGRNRVSLWGSTGDEAARAETKKKPALPAVSGR
ncbi:MAG: GGDEF domain-containing protein [Planctomycetes bacterium]|nr:GGDEF domain-containing protein [Planctomycetota bacterium]